MSRPRAAAGAKGYDTPAQQRKDSTTFMVLARHPRRKPRLAAAWHEPDSEPPGVPGRH